MTKDSLLKNAIKEFQTPDSFVYDVERFYSLDGSIVGLRVNLDSKRPIFLSLHSNSSVQGDVVQIKKDITFNTKEALNFETQILNIKGDWFLIDSYKGYNNQPNQYFYSGNLVEKENLFLLNLDENTNYNFSSFHLLRDLDEKIIPFFSYYVDGYIPLRVLKSEDVQIINNKKYLREDHLEFQFYNYPRSEIFDFGEKLKNFSLSSNKFGLTSNPKIFERRISYNGISSICVLLNISISYVLDRGDNKEPSCKKIKEAFFTLRSI